MMKLKIAVLICYTLFIAYVSLAGGKTQDTYVPDLNSFNISGLDKALHFFAYLLFASLSLFTFYSRKAIYISYISIILYSLILELIQSTMPLREASFSDFLANTLGVISIFLLQSWWFSNRSKNSPPDALTNEPHSGEDTLNGKKR